MKKGLKDRPPRSEKRTRAGAPILTTLIVLGLVASVAFVNTPTYFALLGLLTLVVVSPQMESISETCFAKSEVALADPGVLPSASVIVSAYLPNEQGIIIATIKYLLNELCYARRFEVILVYNRSTPLPVEEELRTLAAQDDRLCLIHAEGSRSKAENLNLATLRAAGTVIALFDADARPNPNVLSQAARWIQAGYDFVQGANSIRKTSRSILASLVAAEFLEKCQVSYPARYQSAGICYFSGSNGYWSKKALAAIRFDEGVFVEDIEASLCLALCGARCGYDSTIGCSELAPPNWRAWWNQRMRWAKGWVELLKRHQIAVITSKWRLSQKAYWTFFLIGRRLLVPAGIMAIGPAILTGPSGGATYAFTAVVFGALTLTWAAAICQALAVTWRKNSIERGLAELITYTIMFPLYDSLRLITTIIALYSRNRAWMVTPRDASKVSYHSSFG